MSPIILKTFSWSEDAQKLYITVPIPGASMQNTDIFITDKYIKIRHASYLWELFLNHAIDYFNSRGKVGNGIVEFTMIKKEPKTWLVIEESLPDNKQCLIDRRMAEVVKIQTLNSELKERNATKKQEQSFNAFGEQMKIEKEEREIIQNKIAASKMEVLKACSMRQENPKRCQGAMTVPEDHAIRNSGTILVKFTPKAVGVPARSSTEPATLEIV